LYFPTPVNAGVQAQSFDLQSDGLRLRGWVVNPGKQDSLIYFGGNAEAVEHNFDLFKRTLPNVTVYLLPYRSYGGNPGEVTEANLYRDALNLHDQTRNHHFRVSVMGRSLGTGVATHLASQRKVDKLLLVTPYDSMINIAQTQYPAFPASWILKDRYESWRLAPKIDSDLLIMIAGNDEIIPLRNTMNLVSHFKRKPEVIVFEGEGHNSISDSAEYDRAIAGFIQ